MTTRQEVERSLLGPLQEADFVWPKLAELKHLQQEHPSEAPTELTDRDGIIRVDDRPCVPGDAKAFINRLLIVGHCGPHGHRGEDVVTALLRQRFEILQLRQ
ncbi:hypothetical protein PHMEG_00022883 [Phytophthora megakarya]|uniref:Uncharacterized protein n=1 Tax=Phytophthora megakarya TaxID=4795 RepID=A0A225VHK8_9STRA|nr:hypothetical protein PHMEG_00022883 [Phytophthora megakarya]